MITKPLPSEYSSFYTNYIEKVTTNDLLAGLAAEHLTTVELLKNLSEEKLLYRYAPEKWTIKDIVLHLVDAERIFAYRALRFARGDAQELVGYDENPYVEQAKATVRSISDLLEEAYFVRQATLKLFGSFDETLWLRQGVANKTKLSVRALGYTIIGHEVHHKEIILSRYLKN